MSRAETICFMRLRLGRPPTRSSMFSLSRARLMILPPACRTHSLYSPTQSSIIALVFQMSEALVNVFLDAGIQNVRLKGGVTLRIDRKVWPKIHGSTNDVVAAIKKAGLLDLLAKETYQSNSLARFLRDLDETGDELPPEFAGVIEANPVYKIVPTRS